MTKVLITGDREWTDKKAIEEIINLVSDDNNLNYLIAIIHGGARGADTIAGEYAKSLGLKVIERKANWKKYGKAAGPMRNSKMLKLKPDICFGFHNDIKNSKGTRGMLKKAKKAGIPTFLISTEF